MTIIEFPLLTPWDVNWYHLYQRYHKENVIIGRLIPTRSPASLAIGDKLLGEEGEITELDELAAIMLAETADIEGDYIDDVDIDIDEDEELAQTESTF